MPDQQNPAKDVQKKRNPDRRRQIWSFMGIVFSFMLLLSLVSYTTADQANGQVRLLDLWKVVTPDEALQAQADRTQNLLGLLGAIISNWFINSTRGYAIIVLPFLGLAWSWYILRKKELHKLILATNYVVAIALFFPRSWVPFVSSEKCRCFPWNGAEPSAISQPIHCTS